MAAPTLGVRVGVFGGLVAAAVAIVTLALGIIFFIGLSGVPPASLALGLLVFTLVAAGIAITIVLGTSLIVAGILTVTVFMVVSIVAGPGVAIVGALLFLILLGALLAVIGNPFGIPFAAFGVLLLVLLLIPVGALVAGIVGPSATLIIVAVLGYVALGLFVAWLVFNVHRMPIEWLGLGGLQAMPAIPLPAVHDLLDAAIKLLEKQEQRQTPIDALTNVFTLGTNTAHVRTDDARTFLYGGQGRDDDAARQYSLDDPSQFDMGWTTYEQVDARAAPLSAGFQAALTSAPAGSAMFWRNIARYWNPFGVLPITLVKEEDIPRFRDLLGVHWNDTSLGPLIIGGRLFVLDLTIFAAMDPPTASSSTRFTPATLTLFRLDGAGTLTPAFTPFLIQVSDGVNTQVYKTEPTNQTTNTAWLYALQALKASSTVWGIWLGHVYRHHIVTAAMQMAMYQRLPPLHPVRQVLGLQSKHTIGFDAVLLLNWSFPPPTSCGTSIEFLQLINAFAAGRIFSDDDPEGALFRQGLPKDSFSNPMLRPPDINLPVFAAVLRAATAAPGTDPVADAIIAGFMPPTGGAPGTAALLAAYRGAEDPALTAALVTDINVLLAGAVFPVPASVVLHTDTAAEVASGLPARRSRLNRMLLQDMYPSSISIMQWNLYPIAHYYVSIYRIAERYVGALMAAIYPAGPGAPVDPKAEEWLLASTVHGNVQGLPVPGASVGQLTTVLTSLIYRITAHGISRLAPVGNPGLSWVGNFPPCLEHSRLPDPLDPAGTGAPSELTTPELLAFMPKTGTIGEMISFIFSFGFTDNFEPLIPVPSANTSGVTNYQIYPFQGLPVACDTALAAFRTDMIGFMRHFIADANRLNLPAVMNFAATLQQIHQWELNIEQ